MNDSSLYPWAGRALSLYRIAGGFLFITYGTMKMFGFPPPPGGVPMPPFNLMSQMGLGAVLEVFGGLAVVLGLFTRPVAFVLAGEMAVVQRQLDLQGNDN